MIPELLTSVKLRMVCTFGWPYSSCFFLATKGEAHVAILVHRIRLLSVAHRIESSEQGFVRRSH